MGDCDHSDMYEQKTKKLVAASIFFMAEGEWLVRSDKRYKIISVHQTVIFNL